MALLIGAIIGAVLGLTGAGGSIFAVPLLILLLGLSPVDAMGIALGAVAASAMLGAIRQRHLVLWTPALLLAIGGMLAAPVGKWLALQFDEQWLMAGFIAIALFIGTRMFAQALRHPELATYVRAGAPGPAVPQEALLCRLSPTGQFQLKPRCLSGLISGGVLVGLASGLFGVGGGFLIVPLLLGLSRLPMSRAVATSLAVITLISASGFASHIVLSGMGDSRLLLQVLAAAIVGMLLSQSLGRRLAGPWLQLMFAALLILVAAYLCLRTFI